MSAPKENLAFTDRLITRLQGISPHDPFAEVGTDYLKRFGRLIYDEKRDLVWVIPTNGAPQVAVWLVLTGEAA